MYVLFVVGVMIRQRVAPIRALHPALLGKMFLQILNAPIVALARTSLKRNNAAKTMAVSAMVFYWKNRQNRLHLVGKLPYNRNRCDGKQCPEQ